MPVLIRLSAQLDQLQLSPMEQEDAGLTISAIPLNGLYDVKLRTFYVGTADEFGFRVSFRAEGAHSGGFITRDPLTAKVVFLVMQRLRFWTQGRQKRMVEYVAEGAMNLALMKGRLLQRNHGPGEIKARLLRLFFKRSNQRANSFGQHTSSIRLSTKAS